MSKTERRKLFQPIPLSSILDPTYQSPFSKLEKFQVDMDISPTFQSKAQQSIWQKLQTSLISAMSNLVLISHPVHASSTSSFTATSHRSASSMSLVPWRSYKSNDLLIKEELVEISPVEPECTPEKSASLYHSVRSGLQCLRYLATHPLQPEDDNRVQSTQTPTRHYHDCRKQNTILVPAIGYSIGGGGALFFPFSSTSDTTSSRCSLSAPTSPTHHYSYQTSKPVISNLFSWAMSGFLSAQQHRQYSSLYKNYCLFSPVHAKGTEVNSPMLSPQKSFGSQDSPRKPNTEGNIEIYITSSSATTGQEIKCSQPVAIHCASSSSPARAIPTNSPGKASSGCILIETNWRRMNDESGSSRANFHSMSVCSSASTLKGSTLTFSCSSAMSSSPRAMMSSARTAAARRFQTESESSADSFVEFSASVESTDSFCIVFESASGACIDQEGLNRDEDDDEWEDDDEDDDDDSDEDDEDQIFNYSSSMSDDIFVDGYIFQADGIDLDVPIPCDQVDHCLAPHKQHKSKKVSFDDENLESIVEFEDDIESKSSRETYWEMQARDRTRFQDRISRTGDIIESVLLPAHRSKIYQQRFVETN